MSRLHKAIVAIGNQMVSCALECEGVARRQQRGILPRCLVLEGAERTSGKGAIVCGLNPGKTKELEKRYYIAHDATYNSVVTFWHQELNKHQYYQRLRKLVKALDLTGPILWTDTVKCQKGDDTETFSHSSFPATVRRCVVNYLHRELEACPEDWIAIGVGREAFTTLSLVCRKRFVLGVPHCTGRFAANDFDGLFDDKDRIRRQFVKQLRESLAKEQTGAVWLAAR
jgi:hypothetical protein